VVPKCCVTFVLASTYLGACVQSVLFTFVFTSLQSLRTSSQHLHVRAGCVKSVLFVSVSDSILILGVMVGGGGSHLLGNDTNRAMTLPSVVQAISVHDVVLGHGSPLYHFVDAERHRRYFELVLKFRSSYDAATSPKDRFLVARNVLRAWKSLDPPGRFLKACSGGSDGPFTWQVVSDQEALESIAKCFNRELEGVSVHHPPQIVRATDQVDSLRIHDVVLGRGPLLYETAGNRCLRDVLRLFHPDYEAASSPKDRFLVAVKLVREWKSLDPPGRFVEQLAASGRESFGWRVVSDKKALEGIARCFSADLASRNGAADGCELPVALAEPVESTDTEERSVNQHFSANELRSSYQEPITRDGASMETRSPQEGSILPFQCDDSTEFVQDKGQDSRRESESNCSDSETGLLEFAASPASTASFDLGVQKIGRRADHQPSTMPKKKMRRTQINYVQQAHGDPLARESLGIIPTSGHPGTIVPAPVDVLLGRGAMVRLHNRFFMDLVRSHRSEYQEARTNGHVSRLREIGKTVVAAVRDKGGRFLRPEFGAAATSIKWIELTDEQAAQKAMASLRDEIRGHRTRAPVQTP
jgi:hypothetical protein